jgi:hypothetical protein
MQKENRRCVLAGSQKSLDVKVLARAVPGSKLGTALVLYFRLAATCTSGTQLRCGLISGAYPFRTPSLRQSRAFALGATREPPWRTSSKTMPRKSWPALRWSPLPSAAGQALIRIRRMLSRTIDGTARWFAATGGQILTRRVSTTFVDVGDHASHGIRDQARLERGRRCEAPDTTEPCAATTWPRIQSNDHLSKIGCGVRPRILAEGGSAAGFKVLQTAQKYPEIAGSKWGGVAKPGEIFQRLSPETDRPRITVV